MGAIAAAGYQPPRAWLADLAADAERRLASSSSGNSSSSSSASSASSSSSSSGRPEDRLGLAAASRMLLCFAQWRYTPGKTVLQQAMAAAEQQLGPGGAHEAAAACRLLAALAALQARPGEPLLQACLSAAEGAMVSERLGADDLALLVDGVSGLGFRPKAGWWVPAPGPAAHHTLPCTACSPAAGAGSRTPAPLLLLPALRRWAAVTEAAVAQGLLARLETPALLALLQALFVQQVAVGPGFKEAAAAELGGRGGGAAAQQARDYLRGLP